MRDMEYTKRSAFVYQLFAKWMFNESEAVVAQIGNPKTSYKAVFLEGIRLFFCAVERGLKCSSS